MDRDRATGKGWEPELEELKERKALAALMGGAGKVARHKGLGKLTVRERIDALVDRDSFHELGSIAGKARYDENGNLAGFTPANLVMGRARLGGRPVAIAGDDFTVRGGANDAAIREKLVLVEQMAHDLRIPIVRLIDGTGGGGSVKNIEIEGRTPLPSMPFWQLCVDNLSRVPVVALALGSVAGLGAARVAASHYSVIVNHRGNHRPARYAPGPDRVRGTCRPAAHPRTAELRLPSVR